MGFHRRLLARPGRLVPLSAKGLRAGAVRLLPRGAMDWHSTKHREELLISLAGCVSLEVQTSSALRRVSLRAGQSAFLPMNTRHRVVNRGSAVARYVYVTAPVR